MALPFACAQVELVVELTVRATVDPAAIVVVAIVVHPRLSVIVVV